MKMNREIFKRLIDRSYVALIFRYVIAGLSGVLANLLVFTVLHVKYDTWYIHSAFYGFLAAYAVTFTMHKYWTFKERSIEKLYKQSGLYLFSAVCVLLLNVSLLHVLVGVGIEPVVAQIFSLGLVAVLSFIFTSQVTFQKQVEHFIPSIKNSTDPMSSPPKLSIIIPAYNEQDTILEVLQKVKQALQDYQTEVIVIDDGSTDNTRSLLKSVADEHLIIFQSENGGKGSAIRAGIAHATGTHIVIQDADLEYDPQDLKTMLEVMLREKYQALYGSRSLIHGRNRNAGFSFYWGGQLVTLIANVLYAQRLTDEPTCYKMFDAQLLKSLPLTCRGFEFCPEVTAQVAKRGVKIPEIPISYFPRDAAAGKKIRWRDGVEAVYILIKCRL